MRFIVVMGNVGSDPEERVTPSGQKLTTFNLASNSRRKGQEETAWYRVTIWGDRFDRMMPYIKKGSGLVVVGDVREEIYTNRDGQPAISREVTADSLRFLPGKPSSERADQPAQPAVATMAAAAATAAAPAAPVNTNIDDDLPF